MGAGLKNNHKDGLEDWIFPDASLELRSPWTKPKLPARQVIGSLFADWRLNSACININTLYDLFFAGKPE
jgi:hypothetical protein